MVLGYRYGGFPEYVPVAERRKRAARTLAQLRKKGHDPKPATTFWDQAWCDHLESHADLANRLPRGRTYVRNGSVIDLADREGRGATLPRLPRDRDVVLLPRRRVALQAPRGGALRVGARLEHAPELLFTLRAVDGAELVAAAGKAPAFAKVATGHGAIGDEHLAASPRRKPRAARARAR